MDVAEYLERRVPSVRAVNSADGIFLLTSPLGTRIEAVLPRRLVDRYLSHLTENDLLPPQMSAEALLQVHIDEEVFVEGWRQKRFGLRERGRSVEWFSEGERVAPPVPSDGEPEGNWFAYVDRSPD